MNQLHLRRTLYSSLTLAEWTLYSLLKDTEVRQLEKKAIKTIMPKVTFWIKNLETAQKNQGVTEDREKATGFFFDSLYLLNNVHPDDYESVTQEILKAVNNANERRSLPEEVR